MNPVLTYAESFGACVCIKNPHKSPPEGGPPNMFSPQISFFCELKLSQNPRTTPSGRRGKAATTFCLQCPRAAHALRSNLYLQIKVVVGGGGVRTWDPFPNNTEN